MKEIQFCQLLAHFWMLWHHMCLLITAATWADVYLCNYTYLFIFLRNSSLHIGMDTLVKNHNQYLNISVCWMFVSLLFLGFVGLSQDKHAKQTANNCEKLRRARSVSTAYKPCLSICAHSRESTLQQPTVQPPTSESDWWRNRSKPEPRTSLESFFHSDVKSVWFVLLLCLCMCNISSSVLLCSGSCQD